MRKLFRYCLFLMYALSFAACTKGDPAFQVINEDTIPRLKFDNSYTKNFVTGNTKMAFKVDGECHPKVTDIQAKFIGATITATQLRDMTELEPKITCGADGKFSLEIKSFKDLGISLVAETLYEIQVAGITSVGTSKTSSIFLRYSPKVGSPILVTSGGDRETVGENLYSAKNLRVGFKSNELTAPLTQGRQAFEKNGANGYSANIGVRIKND